MAPKRLQKRGRGERAAGPSMGPGIVARPPVGKRTYQFRDGAAPDPLHFAAEQRGRVVPRGDDPGAVVEHAQAHRQAESERPARQL